MDVIVLESRHARRNVRNTQSRWYHRVFPGRAASDGGRLPMRASPMASGLRHSAACARRGGLALATVASRAVASGLASQLAADGRGRTSDVACQRPGTRRRAVRTTRRPKSVRGRPTSVVRLAATPHIRDMDSPSRFLAASASHLPESALARADVGSRARAHARALNLATMRALSRRGRADPASAVSQKTCKTFRAAARLTGRPIVPRHARDVLVLARRRGSLGTRLAPAQWRGRLVRHSRSRVW